MFSIFVDLDLCSTSFLCLRVVAHTTLQDRRQMFIALFKDNLLDLDFKDISDTTMCLLRLRRRDIHCTLVVSVVLCGLSFYTPNSYVVYSCMFLLYCSVSSLS